MAECADDNYLLLYARFVASRAHDYLSPRRNSVASGVLRFAEERMPDLAWLTTDEHRRYIRQ
jgi:hypothetical protein